MRPGTMKRIEKFEQSIKKLESLKDKSKDLFYSDLFLVDALERNIQVAVEAVMDVARMVISSAGWKVPSTYREVAEVLHENKVIPESLMNDLKRTIGLRNILVHMYVDVKLH